MNMNNDTSLRPRTVRVVETDALQAEDLRDLAMGRIIALRIPGYYPEMASHEVAERFLCHPRFGYYEAAKDIGRVGISFFDTIDNPELRETYFKEARPAMDDLRRTCSPFASPIDRLRVELQEAWPHGANLAHIGGRSMFAGLARVFRGKAEALPHQDELELDARDCPNAPKVTAQIAANVYLRPAMEGGELELWNERFTEIEFNARRYRDTYGLDRALIPASAALLAPRTGELILFNSNKVHAVRATHAGVRVTMSCFIGYQGPDKNLIYWS